MSLVPTTWMGISLIVWIQILLVIYLVRQAVPRISEEGNRPGSDVSSSRRGRLRITTDLYLQGPSCSACSGSGVHCDGPGFGGRHNSQFDPSALGASHP